jgi:hypothetical protein
MIETLPNTCLAPNENDILLGRGGKNNKHRGNEQLREMARKKVTKYCTCTKKEKSSMKIELARRIQEMNPPGRFLRKDKVAGKWIEVNDLTAFEKTSQALRDAVLEQVKKSESDSESSFKRPLTPPLSSEEQENKSKRKRKRLRPQDSPKKLTKPRTLLLLQDEPPLPPPQVPIHWMKDLHSPRKGSQDLGSTNFLEFQQVRSLHHDETILPWNDPCWNEFIGLFL